MEQADASAVLTVASPSRKGVVPQEDQDMLLARALQEQEHAFMLLSQQGLYYDDDADGAAYSPGGHSVGANDDDGGDPAAAAMQAEGGAGAAGAGAEGEDSDAALAARLHAEEQAALHRRILEMSGFRAAAAGEGADGDEDEDEDGGSGGDAPSELDLDALSYEDLQALGDVAGVVSRGLKPEAIAALRTATLRELRAEAQAAAAQRGACGGSGENNTANGGTGGGSSDNNGAPPQEERCTICLVDLEEDEPLAVLPCGHAYHAGCIAEWLRVNKVCAVCTREVGGGSG